MSIYIYGLTHAYVTDWHVHSKILARKMLCWLLAFSFLLGQILFSPFSASHKKINVLETKGVHCVQELTSWNVHEQDTFKKISFALRSLAHWKWTMIVSAQMTITCVFSVFMLFCLVFVDFVLSSNLRGSYKWNDMLLLMCHIYMLIIILVWF